MLNELTRLLNTTALLSGVAMGVGGTCLEVTLWKAF